MKRIDIIVIGAGHAGIEAALASARIGCRTLLITFRSDTIGLMSCNPAIGGVGKGQLVKEIDALGGQMGQAADACGVQFRILNASKGAAVQSSRAQIDRQLYQKYMQAATEKEANLSVKEAEVSKLIVEDNKIRGVVTEDNEEIKADAVVLCPGTFLNGVIHVGLEHKQGGRINESASLRLAVNLKELGFNILRFKTGTCPRLDTGTIEYFRLKVQEGDNPPRPFSFTTKRILQKQLPCHITYTNAKTHEIIRNNLDRSPLYAGIIKSTGVRYCPSIEDKVVKFSERERHQVFLEPDGYTSSEVYPNGLSTSLPEDVQLEMIHSIEGLENAKIIRFGYGIEHNVVDPLQLFSTLETKMIKGLFLAGQINGTTGYEEAAAQGLIAGINAARLAQGKNSFILDRSTSYIGVLIDDLTTKGTLEPYRMFTSRVEYRLIIREDNADMRLSRLGFELGLVNKQRAQEVQEKSQEIIKYSDYLRTIRIKPSEKVNLSFAQAGMAALKKVVSLEDILKRPQATWGLLRALDQGCNDLSDSVAKAVETEVKYSGFIERQLKEVGRFKNLEKIRLTADLDYSLIHGLSREIKEKLTQAKPLNLGQASRISGVTPAAISILMVYLKKLNGPRPS